MASNIALLSLPLLAVGAQHGHNHNHARAHDAALQQRSAANPACDNSIITITETKTVTITVQPGGSSAAQSPAPIVSLTSAQASPPAAPSAAQPPAKNGSGVAQPSGGAGGKPASTDEHGFTTLQPIPNSALVKNSCGYPIYIWSHGDPSCEGKAASGQKIEANGTYSETLRKCSAGGVSLKISKTQDTAKPMQFEYAVWTDESKVSYDISYLDCMNTEDGAQDLSNCPGHEKGIQAMGGGEGSPTYQCPANQWCDKHAYVVAEFGYKPGAPVGSCAVDEGVAFEICAESQTLPGVRDATTAWR